MAHNIYVNGEIETFDETPEQFAELVYKHMGHDAAEWFDDFLADYRSMENLLSEDEE